jgi:hypothetical protein
MIERVASVGYAETHYLTLAEAKEYGYELGPHFLDKPEDYCVLVDYEAMFRISKRGKEALELFYASGRTRIYPPLELVNCERRA